MTVVSVQQAADRAQAAADPAHWSGPRINPATGLAAGYLDHFNNAIMLLELVAATPDCAKDFYAWRPLSYREHLEASNSRDRNRAIAAYEAADPLVRARFDMLTASMIEVLLATRDVMQSNPPSPALGMLANRAASWLGVLVVQADAVVNGTDLGPLPAGP